MDVRTREIFRSCSNRMLILDISNPRDSVTAEATAAKIPLCIRKNGNLLFA